MPWGWKIRIDSLNRISEVVIRKDRQIVCVWFALLSFHFLLSREAPYLFGDEYGILGAAGVMAGFDWAAPGGMPFYGFLLSILAFPFFLLGLDLTTIYRAVLLINGMLITASALLALQVLRLTVPELSRWASLLAVIGAFSYPAVLFYGGMALGETILLFCIALFIYGFCRLAKEATIDRVAVISLGLAMSLAPYAHSRGLVLIAAGVPALALAVWVRSIQPRSLLYILMIALPVYGVMASIRNWLVENFYGGVLAHNASASASGFFRERVLSATDPERVIGVLAAGLGQTTYVITATFGLIVVSIVVCLGFMKANLPFAKQYAALRDPGSKSIAFVVIFYLLLLFLGMVTVSILFLGGGVRADHYFYGRYIEVVVPFVLLPGLVWLSHSNGQHYLIRISLLVIGLLVSIIGALALHMLPEDVFQRPMIWNSISSWLIHIQGPWRVVPFDVAIGVFVASIWLVLAYLVSRWIFQLVVVLMFVSVAQHAADMQHQGADREWGSFALLSREYPDLFEGLLVDASQFEGSMQGAGMAFQMAAPQSSVLFDRAKDLVPDVTLAGVETACDGQHHFLVGDKVKACFNTNQGVQRVSGLLGQVGVVKPARTLPPASLEVVSDSISVIPTMHGACGQLSRLFFARFARYCLPKVNVLVSRPELTGEERVRLGLFVSDQSGQWISEWRASLDLEGLAVGDTISVTSRVIVPRNVANGQYQVNVALLDEQGWDWRSVGRAPIEVR